MSSPIIHFDQHRAFTRSHDTSPPRLRYARPPQHEAYSIRCRFCDSCAGKKYLMPDPGGATVSLPKAVQESGGSFRCRQFFSSGKSFCGVEFHKTTRLGIVDATSAYRAIEKIYRSAAANL